MAMAPTTGRQKYVPPHLRGGHRAGRRFVVGLSDKQCAGGDNGTAKKDWLSPNSLKRKKPNTETIRPLDAETTDGAPQYLYLIRHGDRWDCDNPGWQKTSARPLDTPLSPLGHNQARETGLFLQQLFEEDGISSPEDITWMSSPFLRCLQTSNDALNALTLPNANRIRILPEYAVCEWSHHNAPPPLEERMHYFPRLDITYRSMFLPRPEEVRPVFQHRCERAAASIGERFPYRPHTALVVFTHAAPCLNIAEAAAKVTWADLNPVAPCGVYRLSRTNKEQRVWTIDARDGERGDGRRNLNGHTDHMSHICGSTSAYHPLGTEF